MGDLLNAAPCGVLLFDDGGTMLSVNKTLADLLGYKKEELEGRSIEMILSLASRIFYNTHFFPVVRLHSKAEEIFLTLIDREKNDIPVLANAVRRLNNDRYENLAVFMTVFQRRKYEDEILHAKRVAENALKENKDLQTLTHSLETRTRELERQNQKILTINKDLVQFSKIISHDLQEPIRKIMLFSSVLSSTANGHWSEKSLSSLGKIENSAERLRRLTQGLQQYVNVDLDESMTKVNLGNVLAAALIRVKQDRGFDSFKIITDTLPSIDGYAVQLELLFYHLLDNAIQFRKPDEELVVRIDHSLFEENLYRSIRDRYWFVEHVRIIFSDNGSGFDNQYKDYVFDLVKKAHTGSQGLGLGLALIKKIVDNHRGTISIESEPGKGTKVILILPLLSGSK